MTTDNQNCTNSNNQQVVSSRDSEKCAQSKSIARNVKASALPVGSHNKACANCGHDHMCGTCEYMHPICTELFCHCKKFKPQITTNYDKDNVKYQKFKPHSPLSRDSVRETKEKERSSFTREDNTRFPEDTPEDMQRSKLTKTGTSVGLKSQPSGTPLQVCENCGHEESHHFDETTNWCQECSGPECSCKEFKPQNHSPQIVPDKDIIEKLEGTFNLSKKIGKLHIDIDNWVTKDGYIFSIGQREFLHKRLGELLNLHKEFVRRIEMTMLVTPSPMEKGEFILWLSKEIRKLAGDKLRSDEVRGDELSGGKKG